MRTGQHGDRRDDRREGALVVGLTGGIASGKSTALAMFADLGAETVSADTLVHQAYELPLVRTAVTERLGEGYLRPDGSIDRQKLGVRIFAHPEERTFLEELLHPLAWERLVAFVADAPPDAIVVAEIPLLFEVRAHELFDVTVAVAADSALRRRRVARRFSDEDFTGREAAQVSDAERRRLADYFYVNEGSQAELRVWVSHVWEELRRLQERGGV